LGCVFWALPASEILSEAEVFAQVDTAWFEDTTELATHGFELGIINY
jgi:hypothetical protein